MCVQPKWAKKGEVERGVLKPGLSPRIPLLALSLDREICLRSLPGSPLHQGRPSAHLGSVQAFPVQLVGASTP